MKIEIISGEGSSYDTPALLCTPLDGIPLTRDECWKLMNQLLVALVSTDPSFEKEMNRECA